MKRSAVLLTAIFVLCAGPWALAQHRDLSIGGFGAYTGTDTGLGLNQTATTSFGILGSFRRYADNKAHAGYELSYGFTQNSQVLTNLDGSPSARAQTRVHEFGGAYVYRFMRGPIEPFAMLGGSWMIFSPTGESIEESPLPEPQKRNRIGLLYGAGVDCRLLDSLAVRAQLRNTLYEAPDLYGQNISQHTSRPTQMYEPTIGVVWRF
jgi:opacity protein-like surface antigen